MKRFALIIAAAALTGASLPAVSSVTDADMLGSAAQGSAAQRTIVIDPKTRWVAVERGEVVRFVSNGQEFAWSFNGMSSSLDLRRIAPAGTIDRRLVVYVWPNELDREDNN